jgi:hypothetical protein
LLSIAYVSATTEAMTEDGVAAILVKSRANNRRLGLTGALLYHGGRFIQMLEGPDDEVRARYEIIAADPRHRNVQLISDTAIVERQFPEWTMGFRAPADSALKGFAGFEDFFGARTDQARIDHAENEAQQFLEWLAEYWLPPRTSALV